MNSPTIHPFPVELGQIQNRTRQWLAMIAHTHIKSNGQPWSPAQWLLDNGIDFDHAPLPSRVRRREPKRCYRNSLELAAKGKGRYVYMEGYAARFIITEHAWCYDRQTGLIVDTTWETGSEYIGVPFKTAYARRSLDSGRACLWDYAGDFPIMTGEVSRDEWHEPLTRSAR